MAAAVAVPTAIGRPRAPSSETWTEEVKLIGSDTTSWDNFGGAVAFDGDTALVAAKGAGSLGAAYVFVRSGLVWSQQAKLLPTDGGTGGGFGYSVALDGDAALIGRRNDDAAAPNAGSAYVFVRSGTSWTQQAKLIASDAVSSALFGNAVSIEGGTALIGADDDDHTAGGYDSDEGSAYVFVRSGASWSQQAKLIASDAEWYDEFGSSVSLSGDTAVIGSHWSDDPVSHAGAAYVFVRSGTSWTEQAKLLASDGSYDDELGKAVCIEGDTILLGVAFEDAVAQNSGSAYVFERTGTSWSERAKLIPDDAAPGEYFGRSVAIDGDRLLIGASGGYLGSTAGSAYVFGRRGPGWIQQARLEAGDGKPDDYFGVSVALSGDSALNGAYLDDSSGTSSGSAYVFSLLGPPGVGYCFGDPGSGTPCPCNNDNDGSVPGSGCDNGVFASGAQLVGTGIASVGNDSLTLTATHQEPYNSGLYFQAMNDLSPGVVWGDGLRCAGGGEIRLQTRAADATGTSFTTIDIGAKGGVAPGDTRYYQLWYRTTFFPPCGHGVNEFNTSNAGLLTYAGL